MKQLSFFLADEAATLAVGKTLARALCAYPQQRWIIYLRGNLGSGKTTFSRGLLQALGHPGSVKSPTYTLVEPYELPAAAAGINTVYHFDLYRLRDPGELEFLGVQDYFDQAALCLIEWPERGAGYLPAADLTVELSPQEAGRALLMQSGSAAGEQLLNKFSWPEK
jgi:tRNA threonylcarbamoyladenosine biosynthesis protein TsaE